jgi:hypothetical protein
MQRVAVVMVRMMLVCAAAAWVALSGCASSGGDAGFRAESGRYAEAFAAARGTLRDAGFELTREDARLGVLETAPLHEAGFMTPWAGVGDSLAEGWEDTLNDRWRRAEVRFAPAEEEVDFEAGSRHDRDLRERLGPVRGAVRVRVQQAHRPGLQVQTASVRLSDFSRDPALEERGLQPLYLSDDGEDAGLAARLAAEIRRRLAERDTSGAGDGASGGGSGARRDGG